MSKTARVALLVFGHAVACAQIRGQEIHAVEKLEPIERVLWSKKDLAAKAKEADGMGATAAAVRLTPGRRVSGQGTAYRVRLELGLCVIPKSSADDEAAGDCRFDAVDYPELAEGDIENLVGFVERFASIRIKQPEPPVSSYYLRGVWRSTEFRRWIGGAVVNLGTGEEPRFCNIDLGSLTQSLRECLGKLEELKRAGPSVTF